MVNGLKYKIEISVKTEKSKADLEPAIIHKVEKAEKGKTWI